LLRRQKRRHDEKPVSAAADAIKGPMPISWFGGHSINE